MVAQEEVKPDEAKPDEPPPPDSTPEITTNNAGPGGDDGFGLGKYNGANGNGRGIGGNGTGRGGSKFGWYAAKVQRSIQDAVSREPRMKKASMRMEVRIWADGTGRITRTSLKGSTGDSDLDSTIKNDLLTGLQLTDPPPADMPMPIVMVLSARKPAAMTAR